MTFEEDDYSTLDQENDDCGEIIALFGIDGPVGLSFTRLALSAGYHIQAMSSHASSLSIQHENLSVFQGREMTDNDDVVLETILENATYVVCLLGPNKSKSRKQPEYIPGSMFTFIRRLYQFMMKSESVKLFLYQATAITVDTKGRAPALSNFLKYSQKILTNSNNDRMQKDHDSIVEYIGKKSSKSNKIDYIVTRPGSTREGKSCKRLAASKSQPGPIPITYVDLAEFNLCALQLKKLYNTCPYVVGDGF
eukprot:CAMPEP_0178904804 /NCGR_PEP_ID=MMETSP0786-20121207/5899_1 /TAXON_ID=186022 /ORGANISM="Thalassionema frauenfeldii, Strain CCMP 1798" /LENGTH=250 /DNA_ID=CAMNT_0020576293 /DNA_START=20 /DNA_END=773 /DNA_ORIENTATION=+